MQTALCRLLYAFKNAAGEGFILAGEFGKDLPWEKICRFLFECGSIRDPRSFCIEVASRLPELVKLSQIYVYFFDGNGRSTDQYTIGVDRKWLAEYMDYYSYVENQRYRIDPNRYPKLDIDDPSTFLGARNWLTSPADEFRTEYIEKIGITHTVSFALRDAGDAVRAAFMLDKKDGVGFSETEFGILRVIVPQLYNLHMNLYAGHTKRQKIYQISWEYTNLTEREIEVADLLCKGIKPANISKRLNIAKSTTDKHIAHIYEKMNVANCQELLVKLLNS